MQLTQIELSYEDLIVHAFEIMNIDAWASRRYQSCFGDRGLGLPFPEFDAGGVVDVTSFISTSSFSSDAVLKLRQC